MTNDSSPGLSQGVLPDARRGDVAAIAKLCERIRSDLFQIARGVARRRGGSPDGVNGESDLVQSVALRIVQDPGFALAEVYTTDDLRLRLYGLLHERWQARRRAAVRQKRGGGKVRAASQIGRVDDSSPLDHAMDSDPTPQEVTDDLIDILGVFAPNSERRRIVALLLDGRSHEEIGEQLGLSRDAVGRRVRESIVPTLKRLFEVSTDDSSPEA